jgi:hypothetical protein
MAVGVVGAGRVAARAGGVAFAGAIAGVGVAATSTGRPGVGVTSRATIFWVG